MSHPFLETENVVKTFGSLRANDCVDLKISPGEIHGIVGENGAGKSTLMKILYGLDRPDSGTIKLRGKKVDFQSPLDALRQGIGMVHQHFKLVQRLSVLENFILGNEPTRYGGFISREKAKQKLLKLQKEFNSNLPLDIPVQKLSVGDQQRLEIFKLLSRDIECLIFDEPTAVLAPQEVETFLSFLKNLKASGKTLLLITHKLNEVLKVADRITVMRAGKIVASVCPAETSAVDLAQKMVGREVRSFGSRLSRKNSSSREPLLKVSSLQTEDLAIEFDLHGSEILGIAGVEGNGQAELIECLWGRRPYRGEIQLNQTRLENLSVLKRRRLGLGLVPSDRHREGVILEENLAENFFLGIGHRLPFSFLFPKRALKKEVDECIEKFAVKCGGARSSIGSLSGGNQQKIVVGRELSNRPRVLLACQPTRGVDIGAIEMIHDSILSARENGMGILLISSELDEILALSDRILVMKRGKISASFASIPSDLEKLKFSIGEAML